MGGKAPGPSSSFSASALPRGCGELAASSSTTLARGVGSACHPRTGRRALRCAQSCGAGADRDIRELWFELRDEGPSWTAKAVALVSSCCRLRSGQRGAGVRSDARGDVDLLKVATRAAGITRLVRLGPSSRLLRGRRPQPAGQRDPQPGDLRLMASDGRGSSGRDEGRAQAGTRAAAVVWSGHRDPGGEGGRRWPGRRRRGWSCRPTPRTGVPWDQTRSPKVNGPPAAWDGLGRPAGGKGRAPPAPRRHRGPPLGAEDIPVPSATSLGRSGTSTHPIEGAPAMDGTSSASRCWAWPDRRARAAPSSRSRGGPLDAELGPGGWPTT